MGQLTIDDVVEDALRPLKRHLEGSELRGIAEAIQDAYNMGYSKGYEAGYWHGNDDGRTGIIE